MLTQLDRLDSRSVMPRHPYIRYIDGSDRVYVSVLVYCRDRSFKSKLTAVHLAYACEATMAKEEIAEQREERLAIDAERERDRASRQLHCKN